MTKLRLLSATFGCSLLLLSGCADPPHAATEKYVLLATNIKVPYWQSAQAGLEHAGSLFKVKTEMAGPETYSVSEQHNEFQRLIRQNPSGILVSVSDPKVIRPDIDAAIAQGIPVVTVDSDAETSKRVLFVGTDNYKAGTMGGQVLAKQLNGKGNVVVYTMPEQANLYQRMHGYTDALSRYPGIKVVKTIDIQGDARIAFDSTTELLKDKKVNADAFICLEAIACPEVAEVLSRNNVTGKTVIAMDTDPRTLTWIQKGLITATIGQKPYTMAFYGVKLLDDLHHQKVKDLGRNWRDDAFSSMPSIVDTGATLIDKSNVDTFLKDRESATQKS